MSRPPDYEWAVLDESQDPIPGEPHEVRAEAKRLSKMAETIRDQIGLLTDIAGDENVGKFADKLRDTASELKGDLGKVATRYETVSGYLGSWADDLDHCQSESLKALTKAQAVAPTANSPEAKPAPGQPAPKLTPEQQHHKDVLDHAKQAAQGELAQAKTQLAHTKSHRDERAHHWMQKIEDTEHDGLKDSRWDGIKDFIHEHAGLIKLLADICTWIVTALIIVSLFIPGLDIATALLGGLMLAALLGHTAVALTGDGSWTDVAMDAFAIVTLGTAAWAKGLLDGSTEFAEGVANATRAGAEGEEGGTNASRALAEGADMAEGADQEGFTRLWSSLSDYGTAVGQKFLAGGEKEVLENMTKLRQLAEEFPNTRLFPNALTRAGGFLKTVRIINGAANAADEFSHWAGGSDTFNFIGNLVHGKGFDGDLLHPVVEGDTSKPLPIFGKFKELTTVEVGS
ncbi:hypothetical protein C8250_029930 [Streptomyces sp. So13.3]|uniref:hypothetical protein n=1 Tax=Streptomyces sp. So13.3 TaxID=2136173 RepID=UPI001106CC4E|nr:hypothetical protein [Streptomyces sp. So13.3]QNA75545.1 hypothetical protein C8250_029930 [Streptomyces sp. So13.3]